MDLDFVFFDIQKQQIGLFTDRDCGGDKAAAHDAVFARSETTRQSYVIASLRSQQRIDLPP